ncbi:MAG: lytic transglycosylase domain-containing protein, partial [Leucothrix sp.]
MSIKKQTKGLAASIMACLLIISSQQSQAAVTDENSLENRLKAFNASEPIAKKVTVKRKVVKKRIVKKRAKRKVAKRRRNKRACYQSSTRMLRDRADSFQPSIRNSSRRYGVSEALIISVITAESCFFQHAKSPKNARGLMQLIPATAKRFGVKNAYVASQNIKGGTRYLKFLLERFSGNLHLAVAAYNAGEGAVDRYSGIPPYRETKEYVRRVMSVYRRLQGSEKPKLAERSRSASRNVVANRVRTNAYEPRVTFAKSSSGKGYFIKPDNRWKQKRRVSGLYKVTNHKRTVCRDVSS